MTTGSAQVFYSVYGKPIISEGGPIVPKAEHNITSITPGTPEDLKRICHPNRLFKDLSARKLVTRSAQEQGAFFILPVSADKQNYMLAGRIRPRRERGEGEPGRTYTQMNVFVFEAQDWQSNAPQLLAQVPTWLRAEPDLANPEQREQRHQEILKLVADCRQRRLPFTDESPLPGDDDPENRLLQYLQQSDQLVTGWTDMAGRSAGEQQARFLIATARLLFLLPKKLRPLISLSWGFAEPRPQFSLQWVPGQSELPAPRTDTQAVSSLLINWRKAYLLENVGDWRERLDQQLDLSDYELPEALDAGKARAELHGQFERLQESMAIPALFQYLAGAPDLPPMAAQPATFRALTLVTIAAIVQGCPLKTNPDLVARALGLVTLMAGDEDWAKSWRVLVDNPPLKTHEPPGIWRKQDGRGEEHSIGAVLKRLDKEWRQHQVHVGRWQPPAPDYSPAVKIALGVLSALYPAAPPDLNSYSKIKDFKQFRRLNEWVTHYRDHPPAIAGLPDKLINPAYATRLVALAERATELLTIDPAQLEHILKSDPGVMKMTRGQALSDTRALLLDIAATHQVQYQSWAQSAVVLLEQAFGLDSGQVRGKTSELPPDTALLRIAKLYHLCLEVADKQQGITKNVKGFWREELLQRVDAYRDDLANNGELYPATTVSGEPKPFLGPLTDLLTIPDAKLYQQVLGYFKRKDLPQDQRTPVEIGALLALIQEIPEFLPDHYPGHEYILKILKSCGEDMKGVPNTLLQIYCDTISKLGTPDKMGVANLLEISTILLQTLSGPDEYKQSQAIRLLRSIEDLPSLDQRLQRELRDEKKVLQVIDNLVLDWSSLKEPWLPKTRDSIVASTYPLRHRLAERYGYPYCQYRGRLGDTRNRSQIGKVSDDTQRTLVTARKQASDQTTDPRLIEQVARCAIAEWRDDFKRRDTKGSLFRHPDENVNFQISGFPTTEFALFCLSQYIDNEPQRSKEMIPADIHWIIRFLNSFERGVGRRITDPVPQSLHDYLLSPSQDQGGAFGMWLARRIVSIAVPPPGNAFLDLFGDDSATKRLYKRLWWLDKKIDGFAGLQDEEIPPRLDRYLFVLSLLRVSSSNLKSKEPRLALKEQSLKLLALPPQAQLRIHRYLSECPQLGYWNTINDAINAAFRSPQLRQDEQRVFTAIQRSWDSLH